MANKGQRLNPFQHALKRPDTYIGSVKTVNREAWVYDDEKNVIIKKKVKYNPGLLKLVEEIISNAIDNKWRSQKKNVEMKAIEITADKESGKITVWNDGYFISAIKQEYSYTDPSNQKVTKDELYPAELFFGYMLAGTNYDDDEERKTSGRNGMGAKAANVFSKSFVVEHTDPENGKKFVQEYKDNVTWRSEPKVTSYKSKTGYTQISFIPDFKYFNYEGIDNDLFSLIKKASYDCAMITGLNVVFNGEKIKVNTLAKYAKLYFPDGNNMLSLETKDGDECVIVERMSDKDETDGSDHVSFVNGILTRGGGVHVDAWENAFFPALVKAFNARKPKKGEKSVLKTSAKQLYPYFVIFIRCELTNPTFDSQTKDKLNGPEKINVSKPEAAQLAKVLKWDFVSLLEDKLAAKADRAAARKEGNTGAILRFGAKLEDANWAGGKNSKDCTLLITEGLSAKTLAMTGIAAVKGQDKFGAYAIKGKFINVQNASIREINESEEVNHLKKILGLRSSVDYSKDENFSSLRYGQVWFFADADDDGIHIRGLLLNFFYTQFPSLLNRNYIHSLSSPVIKVTKSPKVILSFYSNPDYKKWQKESTGKEVVKYYKGLGTFKAGDAKELLEIPKVITYMLEGDEKEYMELGFNSSASDWRKEWITRDMPQDEKEEKKEEENFTYEGEMSISLFVDSQLIIYHKMVLRRAIPSVFDGFKEAQRKVFFGILQKRLKKPEQVARLRGTIGEKAVYHHGEKSLDGTIINMAQGFVGSNNIPLLVNEGQFGTRILGGEDAAASRYIYTMLEKISEVLFPEVDENLLSYMMEENTPIEPEFYVPILPMVLVNGTDGIASGYMTHVPCYNPIELVEWIKTWLKNRESTKKLKKLVPWYRNFKGTMEIVKMKTKKENAIGWRSKGILEKGEGKESAWWHIRELPIGLWTGKFKEYLEDLSSYTDKKTGKKTTLITDMKTYNTPNTVHFMIKPSKDFIPDMDTAGNLKCMQKTTSLGNMVLLNKFGYPIRYNSPEAILEEFCPTRLTMYERRKNMLLKQWALELEKEGNRYKYVKAVVDKVLVMNQEDEKLEADMIKLGLKKLPHGAKEDPSFEYLLSMQMRSMTQRKLEELQKEVDSTKKKINDMKGKSGSDLWIQELDDFMKAYEKFIKTRNDDM